MLTATRGSVTFVQSVGVAPSTTTMHIPGPAGLGGASLPSVMQSVVPGRTAPDRVYKPSARYYVPYASIEDLRSANAAGLGIINESDAWLTGRPYGLPGTTAITLHQRPGGYHSPQGHHYTASLRGAGFGDTDVQLQALVEQQRVQAEQLKRIAFWQALGTGLSIGAVALSAAWGIATYVRSR